MWWYRVKNKSCRNFSALEIGDVFVNGATTSCAMDKRTPQLDSARRIGLGTMLQAFLIVVENGGKGGE